MTSKSATLIDNIVMSLDLYDKQMSCIILNDITDHFPCFSIVQNCLPNREEACQTLTRSLNKKSLDKLANELSKVDWSDVTTYKDVNLWMSKFHEKILTKLDEVSPEQLNTVSTQKGTDERWMTKGLLKCSRKQLILYSGTLKSGAAPDWEWYKNYRNVFKRLKRSCKETYFVNKCYEFCSNGKKLLEMINYSISKTPDKRCAITKITVKDVEMSNSEVIANKLATHFASIGKIYAQKIMPSKTPLPEYLHKIPSDSNSLFLTPTCELEVKRLIDGLANKTSSG